MLSPARLRPGLLMLLAVPFVLSGVLLTSTDFNYAAHPFVWFGLFMAALIAGLSVVAWVVVKAVRRLASTPTRPIEEIRRRTRGRPQRHRLGDRLTGM